MHWKLLAVRCGLLLVAWAITVQLGINIALSLVMLHSGHYVKGAIGLVVFPTALIAMHLMLYALYEDAGEVYRRYKE